MEIKIIQENCQNLKYTIEEFSLRTTTSWSSFKELENKELLTKERKLKLVKPNLRETWKIHKDWIKARIPMNFLFKIERLLENLIIRRKLWEQKEYSKKIHLGRI